MAETSGYMTYERFEKLSDVAKWCEEEEGHIYEKINDEWVLVNVWTDGIFPDHEYYRRIDVKPFECWGVFSKDGSLVGTAECENPPRLLPGQRAARLREVVE